MKLNAKRIMGRVKESLAAAGGGVAAAWVNNIIPSTLNSKVKLGGKLLVGALVPELMPKQKILVNAADGWCGVVGVELAHEFGMKVDVAGIGDCGAHEIDEDYMDGVDEDVVNDGVGEDDPVS